MCFAVVGVLKAFCVVVLTCSERNLGTIVVTRFQYLKIYKGKYICDSIGNHMVLKKIYKNT